MHSNADRGYSELDHRHVCALPHRQDLAAHALVSKAASVVQPPFAELLRKPAAQVQSGIYFHVMERPALPLWIRL